MGETKTVSLVLGSGGARGLAHIGIIKWLSENGYEIKSISGSSMGALVGGVYAAGKLDVFEEWVCAITTVNIFTFLDFSLQKGGFFKGDKVIDALKGLVGDTLIESLPLTYTAVATDIKDEREVWIRKGSLFDAIRASISLPLFLTPFELNGVKLIDGGVLNPVPIAPTFMDDTDITIAVNLGAVNHSEKDKTPEMINATPPEKEEKQSDFQSRISRLQPRQKLKLWNPLKLLPKPLQRRRMLPPELPVESPAETPAEENAAPEATHPGCQCRRPSQ